MKNINRVKVPTGTIYTATGEKNLPLEFLSIGDYGKHNNLKADFLGLKEEINGVKHTDLLPLSEKWVVTISTQYGCSMKCSFCDVPLVGSGRNVTFKDLINQVINAIGDHPEITYTDRLNLHYARMGEPSFNSEVIQSAYWLAGYFESKMWGFHPVISTMMPINNRFLTNFIDMWLTFKNEIMGGNAGLQLSINTTDEIKRAEMFSNNAMSLKSISSLMKDSIKYLGLKGRKIALNFALTDNEINAEYLRDLFDPKYFLCKITPMHLTGSCNSNGLVTKDGYDRYYPYKEVEDGLKEQGFDVIVFIPSKEEDESRITCGNAILSDR